MNFFDRIKELARAKNITIAAVAKASGLSLDSYNTHRKRNNLPRAGEAVKMAAYLRTTVEYLVTGEEAAITPERFRPLIKALLLLSEDNILDVETLVYTMAERAQKKKNTEEAQVSI
jgi:transcriptional regulator with XRE-family HTH domain